MSSRELEVDMSVIHLTWTVDNESIDTFSSDFRFEGGGWKLGYYKRGTWYRLDLLKCSGVARLHPLRVSVHAERSEDGRTVKVLPEERSFTDEFEKEHFGRLVWCKTQQAILGSAPEFRLHGALKLIVVLKVGEDSTSTLLSSDASVQTTSSIPCLEGLSEDLSRLLDEGPNPDVEFQCGGKSTKAHGAVVSARSQVIAKMLAADMVEGRTKIVKIPDMGPHVFEKFLRYLYTGKLDGPTFAVALRLFEAGDQYDVTGLARRCSEYLVEHLSVENACEVLVIADAHSDEGLVEKVVDYMVDERVPAAFKEWPAFCGKHPTLAIKVLSRRWQAVEI